MSKYLELARKLKALADRGVGGEKENAKTMLKALMKKYGFTVADIDGEEIDWQEIKGVTSEKNKLFHQVCYHVCGKKYRKMGVKKYKNIRFLHSTKAEAIEVEAKLNFFWKLYEEELQIFHHAFVQRNNIYAEDGDASEPKTKEELDHARRVAEMSRTIKRQSYSKLLT